MDPVSALGLAASVVQCVQFTSSLLKGTHKIYSSSQGFSAQSQELDRVYGQLSAFSSDFAKQLTSPSQPGTGPSRYEASLKKLAESCHEACDELLSVVLRLRAGNGTQRLWKSFRKALKETMKQEDLRQLEERIRRIELSMNLHMSAISIEHTERLHSEVQRLVSQSQQLYCSHDTTLQRIHTDISQILQELHRRQGQRGSDRPIGVDIGYLTTKLSELSLESRRIIISQEILATLDYPQRPARHGNIFEAHAQTYSWALQGYETDEVVMPKHGQGNLLRWLQSGHGMFWVSGKPGSGKSTFLKFIADHPETQKALSSWASPHGVIIASHYLWSAGTEMQKSQQGLWQSLLFQILSKIPDAIPEVCKDQWQLKAAYPEHNLNQSVGSISELRNCFARLAQLELTKSRCCIFIDGLDEIDSDHLDIAQTLVKLSHSPIIKLCVSSRPWNVFEMSLGCSPLSKIYMDELTRDDVLQFSESQLAQHPRWTTEVPPADAASLIKDIADRAQGVFLWVVLVTKLLREGLTNDDTLVDLRKMLYSTHPDLEQFFKQILDGVPYQYHEKMASFLGIALTASKPLDAYVYHFHELEYGDAGFAMKENISSHDAKDKLEIRERVRRRLDALCKGLLEVNAKGKVQFIHQTVTDWLKTKVMMIYLEDKLKPDFCPCLSILRALLAWHKHPLVDDYIDVTNREEACILYKGRVPNRLQNALAYTDSVESFAWFDPCTIYKGCVPNRLRDALAYANPMESMAWLLDRAHLISEAYGILDEMFSVTEQIFEAKLVAFSDIVSESTCEVMLSSIFADGAPWGYLVRKARECPGYFVPLIRHPYVTDLRSWLLPHDTQSETDCTRSEVATIILELSINEYVSEEILVPDGDPLNSWDYFYMLQLWHRSNIQTIVEAGADTNVIIWRTADAPPIRAWMVFILLACKVASSSKTLGNGPRFSELFDNMDLSTFSTSSETRGASWEFLCSHISALRKSWNAFDNVPQVSATEDSVRLGFADIERYEELFGVITILIDKLSTFGDCNDLSWRSLMTAINEGLPPQFGERFSKRLEEVLPKNEGPEAGPTGKVQIVNMVGPAAPQLVRPEGSRKRSPAELLDYEPLKRARRCSF